MQNLDFQPRMVGRDSELKELQAYLDKAAEDQGNLVFISGEAGIGKTRLVEELKQIARSLGFQILSGNCMYESLTPFMPIMEALRSVGLESLFAEEAPKVEAVYLITPSGLLVKDVVRQETELDSDLFSSVITTLSEFASQSLSKLLGEKKEGTINSVGYENYRILIESRKNLNLVVIISGKENEFLINDMGEIFSKVNKSYGDILENWDGDEENVKGIEEFLEPLITSGKFDGIYYGKEDPKIRRNLLFENVSLGLIRQAQEKPTLLCVEDLQWADPSSLALMHYIARNSRRNSLVIIGSYRPEDIITVDGKDHPLVGTMQQMEREDLYNKMELARLLEGSIDEFLFALLGNTDFTNEFKNQIYKETEGNPLFIIQLVKFLVEEKIIKSDNKTWRLIKDLKDIEIPFKIYNVIERRLKRLDKEDRKVLDYASVIGEKFDSSVLTDALDMKRTQLLEQLRGLEQTHRLIKSHNGKFMFDHAKIKEVLYTEIPDELRRNYHSIIANSIETLNKDKVDEIIGDLAFHYYQCKNKEKALTYLIKAAEKAKKDYSNEETIRFYNETLEFEEDTKKRMVILEDLGDIYKLIGDYDKSIASYKKILKSVKEKKKEAEIKAKIGDVHMVLGKYDEAIKVCCEALDSVRDMGCKEEAFILERIGYGYWKKDDYEKALEYLNMSFELSESIGDNRNIAMTHKSIGNVYLYRSEYDKALKHYNKGLPEFKKVGDQWSLSKSFNNIGIVYREKGEYDKALSYFEQSHEIAEKIGFQGIKTLIHINIGIVYFYNGKLDKALERFEQGLKISESIGDQLHMSASKRYIGLVKREKGELDEALKYFKHSLEISQKIDKKMEMVSSLNHIGSVYERKGEYDKALEYLEKSRKIAETIGVQWDLTQIYCDIAMVYFGKKSFLESLEFCNLASVLSNKIGSKEYSARSRRIFGKIYCEQNKWGESIENFKLSIKDFKEIGMKLEQAESHFEFGLMWKAKGDVDKAKEHFQKAFDIFEELKIEKWVEKVKAALDTL